MAIIAVIIAGSNFRTPTGSSQVEQDRQAYDAARGNIERLKSYVQSCRICGFKSTALSEIGELERSEAARAEGNQYRSAAGNIGSLRAYIRNCKVCAFKAEAEREVARLEQAQLVEQDASSYRSARGNLSALRTYVNSCTLCAFRQEANREISRLERETVAQTEDLQYRAARGDAERLQAYVTSCTVCTFKSEATAEVERLERQKAAHLEERQYGNARGNIELLQEYVRDCQVCDFLSAANDEIERLEEEEERRNPKVTFEVKSNDPNQVMLSFFSLPGATRQWPGNGQAYILSDYDSHEYILGCAAGERICYGAWLSGGNLTPYWGVGRRGREACQNCCVTCPSKFPVTVVLERNESTTPFPTMTWHIENRDSNTVEIAFYDPDRNFKWPPGDQVFRLNPGNSQQFRLNCDAGQKICYGAWPRGNINSYWGVGFNGRNGCTNCCNTCDGGDTQNYVLNPW